MHILSLIGMRGCGKSTIARALTPVTPATTVQDTDDLLVTRAGRTIAKIIETDGWKYFRDLESRVLVGALHDMSPEAPLHILATGGGIILRPENRTALHSRTTCCYLHVPPDVAHRRLLSHPDAAMRPPLSDASLLDEISDTYAHRHPLYLQTAHHTIDAAQPVHDVISAIMKVV